VYSQPQLAVDMPRVGQTKHKGEKIEKSTDGYAILRIISATASLKLKTSA